MRQLLLQMIQQRKREREPESLKVRKSNLKRNNSYQVMSLPKAIPLLKRRPKRNQRRRRLRLMKNLSASMNHTRWNSRQSSVKTSLTMESANLENIAPLPMDKMRSRRKHTSTCSSKLKLVLSSIKILIAPTVRDVNSFTHISSEGNKRQVI